MPDRAATRKDARIPTRPGLTGERRIGDNPPTPGRGERPLVELRLENVSKRFGARTVLTNVCAEVRTGETLLVTGHNGSGKSTLVSIIAGLLRPDRGRVQYLRSGKPVAEDERRRFLALVQPDLTLYPELTALENLEFFARVRGLAWDSPSGGALLERVGLGGRGRDLVGTFSSGMRVRLKYAVALQPEPGILLLDEPTAMLDQSGVALVEQVISEQRGRGVLVLATNDPNEERHGDLFLRLGIAT
jgi:heme exporter protein A